MDRVSDRERAQLRGLVKTVVDGQTRTEFDRDGKLLSVSRRNPDGSEYGDSYTYDDQGRLHLIVSRDWDGRPHEKIYSYGETGWLLKITDSRGELTNYDYNKGHKTETLVVQKTPDAGKPQPPGSI